jgi:hypothetical protein
MQQDRRTRPRLREGDEKPEPSDYGRIGARKRLRRKGTMFRGSRKRARQPGAMCPAGRVGVLSCVDCDAAFSAHASAA